MERRYPVPMKLGIIGEIKRLVSRVREDDKGGFDFFENDIFILFDPNEPVGCGCEEDDGDGVDDDGEPSPPTVTDKNPMMDELRDSAVADEDEAWEHEDEEEDEYIRSVTIGVTSSIFSSFSDPPFSSHAAAPMPLNSGDHDPDCILSQPNFHHKPTNLKIWWTDRMVANQLIKFKSFANIVQQCIASLGRRTEEFMVRGLVFDGDFLDLDRTPPEEEDEENADMPDMP